MQRSRSHSRGPRVGPGGARWAAVSLMVLGLSALTSCAGDSGLVGDAAETGDAGDSDPRHTDGAPDVMPEPVQETQELVSEHLSSWQEYSSPSETELQMAFYSGNPACYGVRSVVEEDAEVVRVATISGTLPEAIDSACTQEARYVSVVIELAEPLGERAVLPLAEVELAD